MQLPGLVIGGGIAGLTAAIALRQCGFEVRVCEAAPQILPLGAGIWMAPNAMQVFERLGLAAGINAGGVPLRNIAIVDQQLRPIMQTDQERVRRRYGHTTTAIQRASLQALLLAEVGPVRVQLGKAFVEATPTSAGVRVRFADGSTQEAAFVIGADGIHSPLRAQLFPEVKGRNSGYRVWRGMTPLQLAAPLRQGIREVWARGLRFGFSEVADGVVDWFVGEPASSWTGQQAGLKAHLLAQFRDFAYPIQEILAATEEAGILRNEISDFPPLPRWSQGRICLIGDAAHAATPYMGQGGCQAVEDAYALAQCLAQQPSVEQAFEAMQQLRRARAGHIVRTSRRLGAVGYWQGPAGAVRDALIRATPGWVLERQFDRVYGLNF